MAVLTNTDALLKNATFSFCLEVQKNLDVRADSPNALNYQETPFLDFIRSQQNNSNNIVTEAMGELAMKAQPNGTPVKVNLIYTAPICDDVEADCPSVGNLCEVAGAYVDTKRVIDFTVTNCDAVMGKIPVEDFRTLCDDADSAFMRELEGKAKLLKRRVNKKSITPLAAYFGDYANGDNSGTTPAVLPLVTINESGVPIANRGGISRINSEYRSRNWFDGYRVFGGEAVAQHNDIATINGATNLPFIYDKDVDLALSELYNDGLMNLVTLPDGIFNFVQWQRNLFYLSSPNKQFEDYARTIMNIDGIDYDFELFRDKCEVTWTYRLSLTWDIFTMPKELYCKGNGDLILRFGGSCGNSACGDFNFATPIV